jgi:tetratricopeptide (TPR) repeat protein
VSVRATLLLACMSLVLGVGRAAAGRPLAATAEVHWSTNYRQARADALRTHRLILVDMETDWCSWCRVMDADVYPALPVAQALSQGYLCIRKNAESDSDGAALQRKFRVMTYPANIVVEPADELYVTLYGYRDAQQFLTEVKAAGDELRQLSRVADRVRAGTATQAERVKLADAFADRGFYDKAAKSYLALLEEPGVKLDPEEQFKAAVALASAGDNQHALAAIGDLENDFPDSEATPEAEALEGEILWHEGDVVRATAIWKQWLAKYPDNPLAEHVRSVLSQAERTQ